MAKLEYILDVMAEMFRGEEKRQWAIARQAFECLGSPESPEEFISAMEKILRKTRIPRAAFKHYKEIQEGRRIPGKAFVAAPVLMVPKRDRRIRAEIEAGMGPRPADYGVRVKPEALERILARQRKAG